MENTFSTKLFSHHAEDKVFSAEASDLADITDGLARYINLKSEKTGTVAMFEAHSVTRSNDTDNEILFWTYVPCLITQNMFPSLVGYRIKIFND